MKNISLKQRLIIPIALLGIVAILSNILSIVNIHNVNASASDIDVEYEIKVIEERNIPTNMKFFAEIRNEQGGVINKTKEYSTFTELASNELLGNIPVEENNQKRIIMVYWNWEYTNDVSLEDKLDATLSYDENGKSSLECGFNIEIVGKQKNK